MSTLDPRLTEELDRLVPLTAVVGDWDAIVRRARARQLRRRLTLLALSTASLLLMLALTPLGGAVVRGVGGFSDWLTGTPGPPATPSAQSTFDKANRFPDHPRLHELLRVNVGERRFFLFGFTTRQVVCLRVTVRALSGAGPQAACASRADLRRSGDLVLPIKANLGMGHVGRVPPTVPKYLLTFGLAVSQVNRVEVEADTGPTAAVVRNGAFLHVLQPGRHGVWARAVKATTRSGRAELVPLSVEASGARPLRTGLKPHGPATVERDVKGGTIGWFARREPRGESARQAGLTALGGCCTGFVRVIHPDPGDFLAVAIGDRTLVPHLPRRARVPGLNAICVGELTRGGLGAGCGLHGLFSEGPLALSWGFSGAGQQFWVVSGVVSDDVARIEVFQGDGRRWAAPLRDNATAFRVLRAKFPARIVGYDIAGRVIAIKTLRGG
jgi:hypothetical protein